MRDLVLIAAVFLCSLVALPRPVFGVLVFVCLGFLNPQSFAWGVGRSFPSSQLIAIATFLGYLCWSERKRFPHQRELFLLLALWGMFGISTLFAIYSEPAQAEFIFVSKILLMVFLGIFLINTADRLHWLLRVIALSLGFHGLKGGIFVILSGGQYTVWGPEGSFLEANNSIGLALAMNIPLLFYLLKIETVIWLRWLIKFMLFFSYPAILATYSRGAWLGLAIVTVLLLLRSKHKFLLAPAAGFLALITIPFLSQVVPERMVQRYDVLVNYENDDSAQSRFWNWEFCKRVGMARPLTGGGFDFYNAELYPIYYPEFVARWGAQKTWSCHSSWLTVFGEHGFPGFLLWLGLITSSFLSLKKLSSLGRNYEPLSWIAQCGSMVGIALIAFVVVGSFIDAAYFDLLYYLIGITIILKEIARVTAAETSPIVNRLVVHRPVVVGGMAIGRGGNQ
jgi:probable O-glycosylation ligase (exosortase A-associated)